MAKRIRSFDVVIVGAGPAGLGMGAALVSLGLESFTILERSAVGASFLRWPEETRFITPSFNSNQFGTLDLNAICPHTSPAYSLGVEHPNGAEYAGYLRAVSEHFDLPVETGVDVSEVTHRSPRRGYRLETSDGPVDARFVIWAAGEAQYPNNGGFEGGELCLHSSKVTAWSDLAVDERYIIGGSESGVDAAVGISAANGNAVVLDHEAPWDRRGPDPSVLLSPFTQARLKSALETGQVTLRGGSGVAAVRRNGNGYHIDLEDGETLHSALRPILASGFVGSATLIESLFEWRDDGFPLLTENDESTKSLGLFLVGPQVRQDDVIFCFIYKFRQRFAVVANQIAERLKIDAEPLEEYRRYGMFLDDLSCCGDDCAC